MTREEKVWIDLVENDYSLDYIKEVYLHPALSGRRTGFLDYLLINILRTQLFSTNEEAELRKLSESVPVFNDYATFEEVLGSNFRRNQGDCLQRLVSAGYQVENEGLVLYVRSSNFRYISVLDRYRLYGKPELRFPGYEYQKLSHKRVMSYVKVVIPISQIISLIVGKEKGSEATVMVRDPEKIKRVWPEMLWRRVL